MKPYSHFSNPSIFMEKDMGEEGGCFHEATIMGQDGIPRTVRVPVVQELARQGLKFLPELFIKARNPSQEANITLPMFPSINMAKLGQQAEPGVRAQELAQLASCAKEWGMFLVTDHGIHPSVVHGVKDVVQGFFRLPLEEKRASVGSYASIDNMGYGRNFVKSEDQPLDWIDRLAMKAAPKGVDEGLLVWPQKPPNFRYFPPRNTSFICTISTLIWLPKIKPATQSACNFIRKSCG